MVPKLNNLLKYENKKIILRHERDYPHAKMPAKQAFSELLKFIWLCLVHQQDKEQHPDNDQLNFTCVMHSEMREIDDIWHTFLLFTQDYHDFCHQYLHGIFFHHIPTTQMKHTIESKEKYERELSNYLSYIYDHLGGKTLSIWFKINF